MDNRIVSHHVGGRFGNRPFPVLEKFEKDFVNVLYDADLDCIPQIKRANEGLESELHVLPYCVGGRDRQSANFYINMDPFTSSLRRFDPKYKSWSYHSGRYSDGVNNYDYIVGETFAPIERRRVRVCTLDTILKRERDLPPPDILTLDTQGTEYDILIGASRALRDSVLAIIAEVEFHALYRGQKLFGDVARYVDRKGFVFARFTKYILEYAPLRAPLGLRGRGFQNASDGLFLRRIESIEKFRDPKKKDAMFEKLAFIAIVFEHFEYALACLQRVGRLTGSREYGTFLIEFKQAADSLPKKYPQTFADRYSPEESIGRFSENAFVPPISAKTKGARVTRPPEIGKATDSPVERVLRAYSLDGQADTLKSIRIEQEQYV
ncbi:MAG: FkbM family methyltransferase [Candidatus Vogelbacteria bacterium]|nr:FkbM family methyltransferase [Candidatus Vogelbacteria bacterium]